MARLKCNRVRIRRALFVLVLTPRRNRRPGSRIAKAVRRLTNPMKKGAFRNGLGVLLISCGLIVILTYALIAYLVVRHPHPADLSAGRPKRSASPSSETLTV